MRTCFILLLCFDVLCGNSQVKWYSGNQRPQDINWNNYSTSYINRKNLSEPVIVSAIPYNGNNANFSDINSNIDLSSDSALFRFRSNLTEKGRKLYTYDSSEVYFLAPGIFHSNAQLYEYRVVLNGNIVVKPWGTINSFTDSSFDLSDFKKGMAFLGGYKTSWDNFFLIELRKAGADTILSSAIVYWKQIRPVVLDIFTANELNSFLSQVKNPYTGISAEEKRNKWKQKYKPGEIDSSTMLPKELILQPGDDNLIFYLEGNIFRKEAIEYQLVKDEKVFNPWKPNDFDNNFIWLKNINPGDYQLQVRYRAQRHNITSYSFAMKPHWYDSFIFKIVVGIVIAGILFLLYRLKRQRQRTATEKIKKEKLSLELKALRSQLNPHFVFNALSSIQSLVNKGEPDKANHYLTEFSSLLRETLVNRDAEYISVDKEIKMLETYLKLEQLRFRFQYSIVAEEGLAMNDIEIPLLLLQPLVENAIKHGAGPLYEKGLVIITFSSMHKNLLADIADNGAGFNSQEPSAGFGLRLVSERIQLLNESLKDQQIHLSIESNQNNQTAVHLTFDNWL